MKITIDIDGTKKEFTSQDDAIDFLEDYESPGNDFESAIIARLTPLFEMYPKIESLNILNIGTFYKYESSGNTYFNDILFANPELLCEDDYEDEEPLYENMIEVLREFQDAIADIVTERSAIREFGQYAPGTVVMMYKEDSIWVIDTETYDPE